jgi:hypothetical protein
MGSPTPRSDRFRRSSRFVIPGVSRSDATQGRQVAGHRLVARCVHFILDEVPEERRGRNEFQVTAMLLMKAADSGSAEDIQKATSQLDLALFLNAMLEMRPDRTPRG